MRKVYLSHRRPAKCSDEPTRQHSLHVVEPASVSQLDARLTGDQVVAGSTLPGWPHSFMEIFYGHSLPSADSRRADVSFWRKNVHNTD